MSGGCQDIHPACAHAFGELVAQTARLNERCESMDQRLGEIQKAVVGNGNPHESLAARVERLESATETVRRCSDRFWKVLGVAAAIAAAMVAILK